MHFSWILSGWTFIPDDKSFSCLPDDRQIGCHQTPSPMPSLIPNISLLKWKAFIQTYKEEAALSKARKRQEEKEVKERKAAEVSRLREAEEQAKEDKILEEADRQKTESMVSYIKVSSFNLYCGWSILCIPFRANAEQEESYSQMLIRTIPFWSCYASKETGLCINRWIPRWEGRDICISTRWWAGNCEATRSSGRKRVSLPSERGMQTSLHWCNWNKGIEQDIYIIFELVNAWQTTLRKFVHLSRCGMARCWWLANSTPKGQYWRMVDWKGPLICSNISCYSESLNNLVKLAADWLGMRKSTAIA